MSKLSEISLHILKRSHGSQVVHLCQITSNTERAKDIVIKLRRHGIPMNPTLDGGFQITDETRLRLALLVLQGGSATVYEISRYLDWSEFETFINRIFDGNDYFVYQNYRFTIKGKRNEIDIIAIKSPLAIIADAKHYSATGRGSIKSAVAAQKQRAYRLSKHLIESSDCPFSNEKIVGIIPLIITWLEESFRIHDDVGIIPIFKLNTFLNSFDYYRDRLYQIPVEFEK